MFAPAMAWQITRSVDAGAQVRAAIDEVMFSLYATIAASLSLRRRPPPPAGIDRLPGISLDS